jgi:hypothetical protein
MRVGGQLHAPATLPPGKRSGTHCIGGWVFNPITKSNYIDVQQYLVKSCNCNMEIQQEFMHSSVFSHILTYTKLLNIQFRRNFEKVNP